MSAGLPRRNLPLPTAKGVKDRATAEQFKQLNYAIQSGQGNTAAAFTQLGITQVQYGTGVTLNGMGSTAVVFNAPFVDANYALMLSPAVTPSSVTKTTTGFTVVLGGAAPAYNIDWVAMR